MSQGEKVNLARAAIHSRRLILQLLRSGPLSRRQLMGLTGLRGSTMTYIVRDLLDCDAVRTVGKRESKAVGKKQILLEVNPNLGWSVGVGIGLDWGFINYLDMAGNVLDQDHFEIGNDLPEILKSLNGRVDSWSSNRGGAIGKMLGIGVGIPGVVNVDTGRIKLSSLLKLQNYSFRDVASEMFGGRVYVDNSVNFAAQAEARVGSAINQKNFVYFHLSVSPKGGAYAFRSIGSAIYLVGKLYRGASYSGGEVARLLQGIEPVNRFDAAEVLLMGEADGAVTDGLNQLAIGMGSSLATLCDFIDPQSVIIGSNMPFCNRKLIDIIQSELNNTLEPVPGRHVPVSASELGDHGVAMGAAITVLDHAVSDVEDGVLSELWNRS